MGGGSNLFYKKRGVSEKEGGRGGGHLKKGEGITYFHTMPFAV